jgi:hypothetical protein
MHVFDGKRTLLLLLLLLLLLPLLLPLLSEELGLPEF